MFKGGESPTEYFVEIRFGIFVNPESFFEDLSFAREIVSLSQLGTEPRPFEILRANGSFYNFGHTVLILVYWSHIVTIPTVGIDPLFPKHIHFPKSDINWGISQCRYLQPPKGGEIPSSCTTFPPSEGNCDPPWAIDMPILLYIIFLGLK